MGHLAESSALRGGMGDKVVQLHSQNEAGSPEVLEHGAVAPLQPLGSKTVKGVQPVDFKQLQAMTGKKQTEDALVVFFAPWCPHCQTFVMKAGGPLEQLEKTISAANGPKVFKYDVRANKKTVPHGYHVRFIPAVYLALKDGQKLKYEGDIDNLDQIKAFALQGASKPSSAKNVTVLSTMHH